MKKNNIEELCPIRNVIGRLGNKWSLLVLVTLYQHNSKLRFSEIHRCIDDISQRMLTVTLRSLEADGLILRHIYPEVPPRVEYELTETGQSLIPHIRSLVDWALENMPAIVDNRRQYETNS